MKEKEILQEIIKWLGNDTSYLSTRTDYARGYKSGIECAKEIVESIINKHEPDLLANCFVCVELLFKIVFIMGYLCIDTIAG